MCNKRHRFRNRSSGQALIESALLIPVLLAIIFNGVNFGYFYYVALNMSSAARSGALYSILGSATPLGTPAPEDGRTGSASIWNPSDLVYQDIIGALPSASTKAEVRVCTAALGTTGSGTGTVAQCYPTLGPPLAEGMGKPFPAPDADPEAPRYILNRVDIAYQFKPLIPGAPFGVVLLATPVCSLTGGSVQCTFQRHVSMRVMN
jgi:hypothetical protein